MTWRGLWSALRPSYFSARKRELRQAQMDDVREHLAKVFADWTYRMWLENLGETIFIPFDGPGELEIEVSPKWDSERGGPIKVWVSLMYTSACDFSPPTYTFMVFPVDSVDC